MGGGGADAASAAGDDRHLPVEFSGVFSLRHRCKKAGAFVRNRDASPGEKSGFPLRRVLALDSGEVYQKPAETTISRYERIR